MNSTDQHISNIADAITEWLQPDNFTLREAIDNTVNGGYFGFEDVKHRILTLKSTLKKGDLHTWAQRSGLRLNSLENKKILCLHAGNLPLVGIHDLLAVVMTGGTYIGKLSRKDPYLLPSLINKLELHKLIENAQWAGRLDKLAGGSPADALLFSGSGKSVKNVEDRLSELMLISGSTPKLIRTANFSIAFITDNNPETMQDLTEAVFRYGGSGCRSVAIVVAPFHLNSEKCSFTDYIESFWLNNPQFNKPPKSLEYRYAYNHAMKIPQAWLQDFLIEENLDIPQEKYILHWVKGDFNTLENVVSRFGNGLQSVYSTSGFIGKKAGPYIIEPLSQAQSPPIWWKPDQTDTITWLQNEL
ncbi:MAG: hypothetical protein EA359_12450 [Balneolaceae bacterium]|nr:MAG: hypothetical protein EA359_12450 [Balneolaceae bacterium]